MMERTIVVKQWSEEQMQRCAYFAGSGGLFCKDLQDNCKASVVNGLYYDIGQHVDSATIVEITLF